MGFAVHKNLLIHCFKKVRQKKATFLGGVTNQKHKIMKIDFYSYYENQLPLTLHSSRSRPAGPLRLSFSLSFEGKTTEKDKAKRKPFMSGNPVTGAVVNIPLKEFFGDDPDFYPADPNRIKALQFDPGFASKLGKIAITSIRLEKK